MPAYTLEFTIKVPISIKKKARHYLSSCPALDLYSQGETEAEAKRNLTEAVKLFLLSCFERGTLDAVLKECGFVPVKKEKALSKNQRFITVPIPFSSSHSPHCPAACHA